jgi:hypothetical protein
MKKRNQRDALYQRIREILESARTSVARTVNSAQVVTSWSIGREIVEEQQRGKKRADYGTRLLADLASRLQTDYGRGFSVNNLKHFRDFYLTYPNLLERGIRHTARGELAPTTFQAVNDLLGSIPGTEKTTFPETPYAFRDDPWRPGQIHLDLSWSHYRTLLRVESAAARAFYEIEAIQNNWSA